MRRRREDRAVQAELDPVVNDAAALLSGRMAGCWGPGDAIPAWVRINVLAHGDWDQLRSLVDQGGFARGSGWDAALGFLAAELVIVAGDPEGLLTLQRSTLIPLELDMLAREPTYVTPVELVQRVRHELARAQARRAHPSAS